MEDSPAPLRIGELLVKGGVLTEDKLENRLELARVIGQPLGQILLESGDLSKYELVCAVQIQSMILDEVLDAEVGARSLELVCRKELDFKDACEQVGAAQEEGTTCRLGELLLGAQLLSPAQLVEAIATNFQSCIPLGQILVQSRVVRPDIVATALSAQRKIRQGKLTRKEAIEQLRTMSAVASAALPAAAVPARATKRHERTPLLINEEKDALERVRSFVWNKIDRSRFDASTIPLQQGEAGDLIGKVVDEDYQVLSFIGAGGMSFVYQVKHRSDERVLALKVMQPRHRGDEEIIRRFEQEAKAVASLDHPNVVAVHDFGITQGGRMFFIMDYLEGVSLSDVVNEEGPLDMARALPIFIATCSAVGHAHSRGIIHRDLKPSNIMLVPGEERRDMVKIVDFGIAKVLPESGQEDLKLTRSGQLFGSPLYMSPEHCLARTLDARSDIYSMGCVMYESLAGKPPFLGATAYEVFFKHMHSRPEPLSARVPDSPLRQGIEEVILKCLAKDPEKRYQSMEELQVALEGLRSTSEGDAASACDQAAPRHPVRIGELLAAAGVVPADEIEERLRVSALIGQPLGQTLVQSGSLTEQHLLSVVELQSLVLDNVLEPTMAVRAVELVCTDDLCLEDALRRLGLAEPFAQSSRLGRLLVGAGLLDEPRLWDALSVCIRDCVPLGHALLQAGALAPQVVADALMMQRKIRSGEVDIDTGIERLRKRRRRRPSARRAK